MRRVAWAEADRVLSGLKTPGARERVVSLVRRAGFEPVSWGSLSSMGALADAITKLEDEMEMLPSRPTRDRERIVLRDLRRRIEVGCWP